MVHTGMIMNDAAMEQYFEEGLVARDWNIQQHEDAAHVAGHALGQEKGETMAIRMAHAKYYADSCSNGYMVARKESLNEQWILPR